ncbi:MAG TPA: elongation factor Ts [Lachnospiraceae bacterium]|nr:elongation factor Ts [Lachnospiraceae bacterium]
MAITASQVKELREMTGSGMMDCKKALTASNGDIEKAVEWLREKGLATAQKKASRIAAEGVSMAAVSGDMKEAVVVEVNSETDFVAQNEKFRNYVQKVAQHALVTTVKSVEEFLNQTSKIDESKTVGEALAAQIAVIGENLKIRRFQQIKEDKGILVSYSHMNGKIVTIVDLETDVDNEAVREIGKNVAMQVAAMRPQYTSADEVSQEFKDHEIEILTKQIAEDPKMAGKPEKVIAGAVQGRLNKELKEICLLDQVYVKAEDGKQTVAQYVAQAGKEAGANVKVKGFIRFETGEGLEKKNEDFAAEVAAQMAGN